MANKLTIAELQALDAQCANLTGTLRTVIGNVNTMTETNATRELAMVKTKIDEAMMWLGRYHAEVCVDLANRTCR
nr:MAG TPA: hypothetical protein [Caudoviricetes sp.]